MASLKRRAFALSLMSAVALTAACGNGVGSNANNTIDARVDATLDHLYQRYPNSRDLAAKANGVLVMPLITEAGFGVGGGYGRGALRVNGVTVDYYSATKGSFGFQIGAQQFANVLFFMTEEALLKFRHSDGWAAGADAEFAFNDVGGNLRAETTTATSPVVSFVFGQAGLMAGATVEGLKYTRIIP